MEKTELSVKKKSIDRALLLYESQPWFRALTQAIPYVGGSIDTILASRGVRLNKKRVNELLSNVSERLSTVEESSLNEAFLQSEEFFDLLRSCAETVARTDSEYKRNHVAAFLAGTIKHGATHDLSQQIIEDIRLLQDFHLHILNTLPQSLIPNILRPEAERESNKVIDLHALKEATGLDWGVFNKGISDLERLGFINYSSEATVWGGGSVDACRATRYLNIFREAVAVDDGT